ncbi:MAG: alanine racemase [Bacteroidetes bacterium]|nr:alanine racemase [Bacteroidota bacterium]
MTGRGWSTERWRAWCTAYAAEHPSCAFQQAVTGPGHGGLSIEERSNPALGTAPTEGQAPLWRLSADTRTLHHPGSTVFFALRGPWHDGHDYVAQARRQGVTKFVLSDRKVAPHVAGCDVLWAPQGLEVMQAMARTQRASFEGLVFAITGSNGKTTVKEWIAALLPEDCAVHRSPLSHNSQLGVPLSVWTLDAHHDVSLIEAGISMPGEMERLAHCIHPTDGVMTHLGDAHLGNFQNRAQHACEKVKLFVGCKRVFLPADVLRQLHELGATQDLLQACLAQGVKPPVWVTWHHVDEESPRTVDGMEVCPALLVSPCDGKAGGSNPWKWTLESKVGGDDDSGGWNVPAVLPFGDVASVRNAWTAALVALHCGVTPEALSERLGALHRLDRRLSSLARPEGGCVILDDRTHDFGALEVALDALDKLPQDLPKMAILGDVPQSGLDPEERAYRLAMTLANSSVSRVWLWVPAWGEKVQRQWQDTLSLEGRAVLTTFVSTLEGLSKELANLEAAYVLIKGSSHVRWQPVVNALVPPRHVTTLTLDATALVDNLRALKARVNAQTVIAVLKGLAYGTDPLTLGRLLQAQGVDWLAVAYAEEGVTLRKGGITSRILVLNPDPSTFDTLWAHQLEPEVVSLTHLHQVHDWALRRGIHAWPVHVKLDTGMHRLGLSRADDLAAAQLLGQGSLALASVMSHLAAADDPSLDDKTRRQLVEFGGRVSAHYPGVPAHILNSAGVARIETILAPALEQSSSTLGVPSYPGLNAIRVGLGMYGLGCASAHLDLCPVLTLQTVVAKLVHLQAGEGAGYGWTDAASHDRTLAVLSVGYADGYPRNLGQGRANVMWNGQLLPTVGRVCMDMMTVDATGHDVHEGDSVTLWGEAPNLDALAEASGTISYELLTRLGPRVQRVIQR